MLTLLLTAVLFLPSSSAQDYTRWHLPEGAIVRFEKGGIGDFAFLPDGNRLAIQSAIGLWIYDINTCLLYTSPSPRDRTRSRMPSSA